MEKKTQADVPDKVLETKSVTQLAVSGEALLMRKVGSRRRQQGNKRGVVGLPC